MTAYAKLPDADPDVLNQIRVMSQELDRRKADHDLTAPYYEESSPIPYAVQQAKLTKAWRFLMPLADAPWGSLVVDSTNDRLEPSGINDSDDTAAEAAWAAWQEASLDAEAKVAHIATLIDGRCFALCWPDNGGPPRITFDDATQMVVMYRDGSRKERVAALRRWVEYDGRQMATLYRPDALFKFQSATTDGATSWEDWEKRTEGGENWPLRNSFNVVPAVELAVNRRLNPGVFPHARGDYRQALGLMDRINLLTFLGLVVAFWMGFPLRGVIGERILKDDDGKVIPVFEAGADEAFQLANPDAKIAEFKAADRSNLAVFDELSQLAVITKTPRHYFPLPGSMANVNADTVRAFEGALHAKVTGYKAGLGEGWEELLRIRGMMGTDTYDLSSRAALQWHDHESRSLAERADAATKLKDILPWQALAEMILNADRDQIGRWEAMRGSDALGQLVAQMQQPAPTNGVTPPGTPPIPAPMPTGTP